jgi:Uma2 family endonuclease
MTPNPTATPDDLAREADEDAEAYLRSLPLEHFVESPAQATQRQITVNSFDRIARARPDVQCFSELLLQYPRPGRTRLGRVVPDNVVFTHPGPLRVPRSYDLRTQPARPLLACEYVSKGNRRKDYEDNYYIYQDDLRVPYYLQFYPDADELTVFRLAAGRYEAVRPNEAGRLAVPELELEVGLAGPWARFWFRGALVPLPADLEDRIEEVEHQLAAERTARLAAERERDAERQRAEVERQARLAAEAELARLRDELARAKGPPAGG